MDLARRMRDRLHYKADIISFMRERIGDIIMMVVNLQIGTETLNAKKIIRGNKKSVFVSKQSTEDGNFVLISLSV